jgi:uncharacterized membrane protein
MRRSKGWAWVPAACLAVGLTAAAPGVSRAVEVVVENYSNDTVVVAVAYRQGWGNLITQGLFPIRPNEPRTFSAPDGADMFLRVQQGDREVTFNGYSAFLYFAVRNDRFTVSKAPDDPSILIFRWGAALENSFDINYGDPPPEGWEGRRFFRVGSGQHRLEVRP